METVDSAPSGLLTVWEIVRISSISLISELNSANLTVWLLEIHSITTTKLGRMSLTISLSKISYSCPGLKTGQLFFFLRNTGYQVNGSTKHDTFSLIPNNP